MCSDKLYALCAPKNYSLIIAWNNQQNLSLFLAKSVYKFEGIESNGQAKWVQTADNFHLVLNSGHVAYLKEAHRLIETN